MRKLFNVPYPTINKKCSTKGNEYNQEWNFVSLFNNNEILHLLLYKQIGYLWKNQWLAVRHPNKYEVQNREKWKHQRQLVIREKEQNHQRAGTTIAGYLRRTTKASETENHYFLLKTYVNLFTNLKDFYLSLHSSNFIILI